MLFALSEQTGQSIIQLTELARTPKARDSVTRIGYVCKRAT